MDSGVVKHHAEGSGKAFSGSACAEDDGVDGDVLFRMRLVERLNGSIGKPPDEDPRGVGGIGRERGYAAVVGDDGGRAAGRKRARGKGCRRRAEFLIGAHAQSAGSGKQRIEGSVVARIRAEAAGGESVGRIA